MKVLIVDDDMQVREMLHETLSALGYESAMAANGEEALAILQDDFFPIVVSDIRMPGIDGIELLKNIKEKYSETEVISITGHSNEYTFTDMIKAGASDLLNKDITSKYLGQKRLKEAERKYRALVEMANEGIISTNKDGIITVFNKKAERIFGYFREEVIGEDIHRLIPDKYYADIKAMYEKIAAWEKPESHGLPMSIMGLRKDGGEIPIELSLSALEDEPGELTCILFVKTNAHTDAA